MNFVHKKNLYILKEFDPRSNFASLYFEIIALFAVFFSLLGLMPAFAEGPDYFRLSGKNASNGATIHGEPSNCSRTIGHIPSHTNRIRNRGCRGGLDFDEWLSASSSEREESRLSIWCEIEYRNVRGWVRGYLLVED